MTSFPIKEVPETHTAADQSRQRIQTEEMQTQREPRDQQPMNDSNQSQMETPDREMLALPNKGMKEQKNTDAIIQYNGKDYIYCDPTYIGADVGKMPESYRGVKPVVIR